MKIDVIGLAQLRRDLKEVGGDLPKQLQQVNKAAAAVIATDARERAESLGGVAAKSAPSIRPGATQTAGLIRLGSDNYPFALGAEFGAIQYKQFKPWRGASGDAGYFLYPAIRDDVPKVVEMYGAELDKLTRKAFP